MGAGISVALLNACSNAAMADNAIPDVISYNYDVRPILSDKCFNCHGPDAQKREAGLRLDIASEAYKALQEHPQKHALVPQLYGRFREELENEYDFGITDVARANSRSLKAHIKTGFQVIHSIGYGGLEWDVVLWDWRK